ncbi:restriction endonuclease subunit S [Mycoplasma bradburyae]|nr:restriction endonuclease subunit S [Mycoplasma bradburyae]UTS70255.1 restriction endonuclease subunit S [Mycoplasma bradburyae]
MKLKDVVTNNGQDGIQAIPSDEMVDGYRYIKISDLGNDGEILQHKKKGIKEKNFEKYILKNNDIVFSIIGTIGKSYLYNPDDGKLVFAGTLTRFNLDESKIYPLFMKYYCLLDECKRWMLDQSTGSIKKGLHANALLEMSIPNIDYYEQVKIGNLLDKITSKILLNNKINDNLKQQMTEMFEYIISSNQLKKIKLNEIAIMYQPKTIRLKQIIKNGKYKVYGTNSVLGYYNDYNHKDQELVLSSVGTCGIPKITDAFSWINGTLMVIKLKPNFQYKEYLFQHLKKINASYLQTGTIQKQLVRRNLNAYNVYVPDLKKLNIFEEFATKNRKLITRNDNENEKLIKLRDLLLPLLMSGQATID